MIQEIFPDGAIYRDSRLKPGDQILEVNGDDLTQASHYHAHQALTNCLPVCRLTVYRERAEDSRPIEKEEILKINLQKVKGRQLGIKLVGKRNGPGVYILTLVSFFPFHFLSIPNVCAANFILGEIYGSSNRLTSCPGVGESHLSAKCHRNWRLALTVWALLLEKTIFHQRTSVAQLLDN